MRMVTAYSMIANGGRRVRPTLVDRIQDPLRPYHLQDTSSSCEGRAAVLRRRWKCAAASSALAIGRTHDGNQTLWGVVL